MKSLRMFATFKIKSPADLVFLLLQVLLGILSTGGPAELRAAGADVRFLRGLVQRDLFESVEFFCARKFANPELSEAEKRGLVAELIRSRTRQMLLADVSRREEFRKKIDDLESDFLGKPDDFSDPERSLGRITIAFQLAIADHALGDWERLEADIAPDSEREGRKREARSTLFRSLERFKSCVEQLETLRQKIGSHPDRDLEHRMLAFHRAIRFQWGLAQEAYALAFDPGEDRVFSLRKAADILSEPASLRIDDPIVHQSRIELARCYRLLGETDRSRDCLNALKNVGLTAELAFAAEAESIRFRIALGTADEIVQRVFGEQSAFEISPDYELARLELLLAILHGTGRGDSGLSESAGAETASGLLNAVVEQIRKLESLSGPYWGRRARMMLSSSNLVGSPSDASGQIDSELLRLLALDQYHNGRYAEAVRLFERAGYLAELSGNADGAFQNALASAAILEKVAERLESVPDVSPEEKSACRQRMIESLRQLSRRFSSRPEAPELHLKGIDAAAGLLRNDGFAVDRYIALLREHVEIWPDSVKVPPLLLRAAFLLEQQGKPAEALALLDKIPNRSPSGREAVEAAARCFHAPASDPEASPGRDSDRIAWFERRLPDDETAWNDADVASALDAAESWIRIFSREPDKAKVANAPKKAEHWLRLALRRHPGLSASTRARIQAMLITALNDQGRREEGAALLESLDERRIGALSPEERRVFQRVRANLLAETGNVQKAVDLLGELCKQDKKDLVSLELLAEILSRQDGPQTRVAALRLWVLLEKEATKGSEAWWNARERILEILLKQGKTDEAEKSFQILRLLYPDLGGSVRKRRLEQRFESLNQ